MRKHILTALLAIFVSLGHAQSIENRLQALVDSVYSANPESVGIIVHVEAPEHNISWSGAAGYSDKDTKSPLEIDQPALVASNTKTYVAAAILKLVEQEKLSIDDSIRDYLSTKTVDLFETDGYLLDSIKVKHLLSHTSGISDYVDQGYIDLISKNPKHRWTRDEQLARAVQVGDPINGPDTIFNYADANYLLCTEIIEQITDRPFYLSMRELLQLEELGLKNTWFPTLEDNPVNTKDLVHQYWEDHQWDTYDIDVSFDLYGGGGIATTAKELAQFSDLFLNDKIVKNKDVKNLIYSNPRTRETISSPYYLGLAQNSFNRLTALGHGGFWGTAVAYFPALETSVSVYVLERNKRQLRDDIFNAISHSLKSEFLDYEIKNREILNYLDSIEDFSGTVLVAHRDSIIHHSAHGLSSIEYDSKNQLNTRFNIASITKLFTAVAALQLHEKGMIDINKTVGTYLEDYPTAMVRDSVLLHQLLSHTSGLQPFYDQPYLDSGKLLYREVEDYLPLILQDSLAFDPGSGYQYTGAGFVVLGLIIEKVSGLNYYDFVSQNIFKKSGMKHTAAIEMDSIVKEKASGYTTLFGANNYLKRNDYYLSKASPGGSHFSTAYDLFLFSRSLRDGTLIQSETFDLMLRPQTWGYNTLLGLGIDIEHRYDETMIGHSGGWFGVRTELIDFLSSQYTVVVLSNIDDNGKTGASKLIDDLKHIIAGEKR